MDAWGLARALHVLGVVVWIGGVAMVTLSVLPAVQHIAGGRDALALFDEIERRFARHARWSTVIVGVSGFYMTAASGLWHRFAELQYWWMHAMVVVWAVFTLVLFVLEPLFLHAWFERRAGRDPAGTLRLIVRLHRVLLAASLVTVAGAAAGSHGGFW